MNVKTLLYSSTISLVFVWMYSKRKTITNETESKITNSEISEGRQPYSIQMYDAIMKYSEMYNIPTRFAFGVAKVETNYDGPFDWRYNHKQTSCVGALGPMQIMPSTCKLMWRKKSFTNEELKNNIDFNVHTSMKLLRNLHDKYKDWKIVFGCYNTGRPMINEYANRVYNHKINWNIN